MTPFRGTSPVQPLQELGRAIAELRLGGSVVVTGGGARWSVRAVEDADASADHVGGRLLLTSERARALGLAVHGQGAIALSIGPTWSADDLRALADPLSGRVPLVPDGDAVGADAVQSAAIALVKMARRLPAAIVTPVSDQADDRLQVTAEAVAAHPRLAGRSLKPVVEARVPLAEAPETRVIIFRPADGGAEQMAIVVGRPRPDEPVLCRLHSECFTGDVLGSMRCDCGEQLQGALRRMTTEGAGVLLYLAQEGRNIGLANKLRAYRLQDQGMDTVDANLHLGFRSDERLWHGAARMLEHLGIGRVRLLTNNPDKVKDMRAHGVDVVERVPHAFAANDHNRAYLRTKALKSGHALYDVIDLISKPDQKAI
ncbi:GTP cyclohydrolase II [Marinivivus vitaminiproducens]|uniref:GTP cyclohydrolase II n=1 Tax=Marinivivus vitaminiproducens TaxID=3035935 RepID=UPI0027A67566|nr:GTP cyclohydrolase II [Geminicoccaceae bacterium SCSIO 64248]